MKIQDQLHHTLSFSDIPQRIISLVPSQTELLVDLGLKDRLVGITKFCVHPPGLRQQKNIVGGTKQVRLEKIKALVPDIILCNKEENTEAMVHELKRIAPVHVSDIYTLEDTYEMIGQYGKIFAVEKAAAKITANIQASYQQFKLQVQAYPYRRVAYLIWRKPWMLAGKPTFIDQLLQLCRFQNVYDGQERYPEIALGKLKEAEIVLLSSEPFPFSEKHIAELAPYTNPDKVELVDGEYFSWYGSRLINAFEYFLSLRTKIESVVSD